MKTPAKITKDKLENKPEFFEQKNLLAEPSAFIKSKEK